MEYEMEKGPQSAHYISKGKVPLEVVQFEVMKKTMEMQTNLLVMLGKINTGIQVLNENMINMGACFFQGLSMIEGEKNGERKTGKDNSDVV